MQSVYSPASAGCLVRLILMALDMGGKCTYISSFFVGFVQYSLSILVQFSSMSFSIHFVRVHVVHPYSSPDTTTARKKVLFTITLTQTFIMMLYYTLLCFYNKEVWDKCFFLQYPSYNVEVVCVSIRTMHFHLGVSVENHYGCNGSLRQHPQSSSCTATYNQSQNRSKLDEPDLQDTAGEVGTSS